MRKLLLNITAILALGFSAYADFQYDLQATLLEGNYFFEDQDKFHYDIFHIYAEGEATVTFDNYDADLFSYQDEYDYNDPHLYLYTIDSRAFTGVDGFSSVYTLYASDDDGNYDLAEGLFFYLPNITFTNELVAIITSYDPESVGTVDFKIMSDKNLTVIPEPAVMGLAGLAGGMLLLIRKRG